MQFSRIIAHLTLAAAIAASIATSTDATMDLVPESKRNIAMINSFATGHQQRSLRVADNSSPEDLLPPNRVQPTGENQLPPYITSSYEKSENIVNTPEVPGNPVPSPENGVPPPAAAGNPVPSPENGVPSPAAAGNPVPSPENGVPPPAAAGNPVPSPENVVPPPAAAGNPVPLPQDTENQPQNSPENNVNPPTPPSTEHTTINESKSGISVLRLNNEGNNFGNGNANLASDLTGNNYQG